jgi:hypothetical protein
VDPVPDPLLLRKSGSAGNATQTSGSVDRNSDHQTTEAVKVRLTLLLSVSLGVLVSSPLCGRLTRYCFFFKSLGLQFVVLSLWGALSDERPGLSFVISGHIFLNNI